MSKVVKSTMGLMLVTILSKILGFGREISLTAAYGASAIADVYITTMSIPTIMFASVGAALATTFIPLFYEIEKLEGKKTALKFANNVFNIVVIISLIISILGFIFAKQIVNIFAIKFTGEKLKLAIEFTRIMIFGIVFIGISNIMTGWLQLKGKFSIPGMIGYPFNICIIIAIFLSSNRDINILAIGTLIGMLGQFLIQLPFAIKNGFKYSLYINFKDKYLKKMTLLVIPVFIGVGVNQINAVIDRSLASSFGDGAITILNSANRLNLFVLGLFITTITAIIYPMLSKLSIESDDNKFVKSVATSINSVILLLIPISVGAIVLANPVVKIVFERGAFNSEATHTTSIALIGYSIGMIGFGLRDVLGRVFYALQDTRTPMVNGALTMGLNIVLNLVIVQFTGYIGLAFATSISSIVCILLLFRSLKKKMGYFGQDKILKTTFKSIISAVVMGIVTYFTYDIFISVLGTGFIMEVISLLGSIGIGAIVYGVLVVILKVEEINIIIDIIKSKLNKNKDCKEALNN